jgi:hypothetical protein
MELKERISQVTTQVTDTVQKAVTNQAARLDAAVSEIHKVQSEGISQAGQLMGGMVRLAGDQLAFVQQLTGELRKLVLGATRRAADALTSEKQA